jgi:hypothetical protein
MEYPLIRKWGEGVTSSSEISALEKRRVSLIIKLGGETKNSRAQTGNNISVV